MLSLLLTKKQIIENPSLYVYAPLPESVKLLAKGGREGGRQVVADSIAGLFVSESSNQKVRHQF
jgi:hypothetical protein